MIAPTRMAAPPRRMPMPGNFRAGAVTRQPVPRLLAPADLGDMNMSRLRRAMPMPVLSAHLSGSAFASIPPIPSAPEPQKVRVVPTSASTAPKPPKPDERALTSASILDHKPAKLDERVPTSASTSTSTSASKPAKSDSSGDDDDDDDDEPRMFSYVPVCPRVFSCVSVMLHYFVVIFCDFM